VPFNANSGEILVMSSHPPYDPNELDVIGAGLLHREDKPLLNRAAQGMYLLQTAAAPMISAAEMDSGVTHTSELHWALGFGAAPSIRLPVGAPGEDMGDRDLRVSPLQLAMAAAALTNDGVLPAPRLALAVNTPRQGWVVLPALDEPRLVFTQQAAHAAALQYRVASEARWQWSTTVSSPGQQLTWYVAGTLPEWQGPPLAVVVLLERTMRGRPPKSGRSCLLRQAP
jgi:hypothetical protein